MSVTTTTLANGHSSSIVNLLSQKVKTNHFKKSLAVDQPDIYDPVHIENENAFLSVIQFFKASEVTNTVFFQFVPAGNLAYKERLILQFSLTRPYAIYFPLLRGLFAFGKLAGISVLEGQNKTFEVSIHSQGAKKALPYFETIFTELAREVKFKLALKKVILVQQQVAKIQKESLNDLYRSLS